MTACDADNFLQKWAHGLDILVRFHGKVESSSNGPELLQTLRLRTRLRPASKFDPGGVDAEFVCCNRLLQTVSSVGPLEP